jgi:C4-dicarboxylate-specific signal transduction histidine kinase
MQAAHFCVWDWDVRADRITRTCDADGRYAEQQLSAEAWLDALHPEDRPCVRRALRDMLDGKRDQYEMEMRVRDESAGWRWTLAMGRVIEREGKSPLRIVGAYIDITQRKQAETIIAEQRLKMVAAARLSSLGVLASGVAHEVNNPLAVIAMGVEQLEMLVRAAPPDMERILDAAAKVHRNISRIERIVHGLRHLSRDGSRDPLQVRRVQDMVSEVLDLCNMRFRSHGVELNVEPIPDDLAIECRPALLAQVLMNLLNNGFDAVEELPVRWVRIACADIGDAIALSVTDSGPGIPVELREKILDPFFTTKEVGKGTGLGLSVSKAIVERHGGDLRLDTTQPHTCFVVELPKLAPASANPPDTT